MKRIISIAAVALIALTAAYQSDAQGRPQGAGANRGQQSSAAQQHEMESMQEQAEERRNEAETMRTEAEAKNREEQSRMEHPPNEHAADQAMATEANRESSETAAEMRDRSETRKSMQEEYRSDREPGQEGGAAAEQNDDTAQEQQQKAKKPWWKFWGD